MAGQADALARLLADHGPPRHAAGRLRGRRILVAGTGTSWHAAQQGAHLLRLAGADVRPAQSTDAALDPRSLDGIDAVIALTHTARKRLTNDLAARARAAGLEVVQISAIDAPGADIETVSRETSAAYTASHLAALLRIAQIAHCLDPDAVEPDGIPEAVRRAHDTPLPDYRLPERVADFIGGGVNQWTAAEGALKIRETAYVASQGLSAEQYLHGPSVSLKPTDLLVCLDGGGPWSGRLREMAGAAGTSGVPVLYIEDHSLPEPLSLFPLTVAVQRIARDAATALGTNADSFGRDLPEREDWARIAL